MIVGDTGAMTDPALTDPSAITLATVEDAETVTRLQIDFDEEFDAPTPPFDVLLRRFRRLLAHPDAFVLLAGPPADPAGHAVVTLRPTIYCDGPLAVLDELYVVPTLRDRGLGTRLLRRAIDEVLARGGGEMHINVDEVDTDTRRFYERHGFVTVEPGTDYRMLCYIRELEDS
ncbi:L-amino acid N-acyltransferase YncA [Brevibacterium sanguinis]|uniref:L-amino acid N-acyltransferase YncA n=2 Tax=Brevibacterium TaxID=1696 RepID=A0A366IQD0_9MICO|nr:L-amino acid N-acyltransferase YncA [Brevibacterium sanguinis]RBP74327.1 L-amino acid N-acyltransferase YncA [Brevibacterium celere]